MNRRLFLKTTAALPLISLIGSEAYGSIRENVPEWEKIFTPNDLQRHIINNALERSSHRPHAHHICNSRRRAGKTHILLALLYRQATEYPGSKCLYLSHTPDNSMLGVLCFEKILREYHYRTKEYVYTGNVNDTTCKSLRFKQSDSIVESIPYHRRHLCGRRYHLICIDNFEHFPQDIYKQFIRPLLNIKTKDIPHPRLITMSGSNV
jgi:hypothetical protein